MPGEQRSEEKDPGPRGVSGPGDVMSQAPALCETCLALYG